MGLIQEARAAVSAVRGVRRRRAELGGWRTPQVIFLYVTNRCNLSCSHCFYSAELNRDDKPELTLEQIEKIMASLKHPLEMIDLTGGEPFLRRDLVEVVSVIHRVNKPKRIILNTNGLQPDKIEAAVKRMLEACPGQALQVAVSLDGAKDMHNEIRKNRYSFDAALSLLKALKREPRLTLRINTAVSARNVDTMPELFERCQDEVGISPTLQVVRAASNSVFNPPRELANSGFDPSAEDLVAGAAEIDELHRRLGGLITSMRAKGRSSIGVRTQQKIRYQLETLRYGVKRVTCVAGKFDGIIYEDGAVAFCENLKTFANLKDYDFDFDRLWNDARTRSLQAKLNCHCIHTCNLATSMGHDYKTQVDIARAMARKEDPLCRPLQA